MNEYQIKYVKTVFERIKEEAVKTKPPGMSMSEAVDILIGDRFERNILNADEVTQIKELKEREDNDRLMVSMDT